MKGLLELIRKFDVDFNGVLELEFKHKECSTKKFLELLTEEHMPIWIEENKDDIEYVNLIKNYIDKFSKYRRS